MKYCIKQNDGTLNYSIYIKKHWYSPYCRIDNCHWTNILDAFNYLKEDLTKKNINFIDNGDYTLIVN